MATMRHHRSVAVKCNNAFLAKIRMIINFRPLKCNGEQKCSEYTV